MSKRCSKNTNLTHRGRKSGKSYSVQVWFVEIEDAVWVATQDEKRNWARNIEASGQAELDLGSGPRSFSVERVTTPNRIEQYQAAAIRKYPIGFRLIRLFVRNRTPAYFRLTAN